MRKLNKKGFTLVEIMIVVAIIGLLAAIAIPNFVKARQRAVWTSCYANLKQIDGAKQIWAIDKGAADNASVTINANLVSDYIKRTPRCQGTTAYTAGAMDAEPSCVTHGNTAAVEAEIQNL